MADRSVLQQGRKPLFSFRRLSWLRRLLELLGILLVWPALGAPECPKVGAIRWDAWYGGKDSVGSAVEAILGPERWHSRLPACAEIVTASEVRINCATQEHMEREIEAARLARLDYWAFLMYPPDSLMSAALNLYLKSDKKGLINFSLISDALSLGDRSEFERTKARIISLMKQPTYQKVLDNRPLFFLGFIGESYIRSRWSTDDGFRDALGSLREAAMASGLANPYLVVMDFHPRRAGELRKRFGFDAVSSYAVQDDGQGAPYARLAAAAHRFWDAARSQGGKVVPIAMAGWDRRPRVQTPAPWEGGKERPDAIKRYYETPSPEQLAEHVQEAVHWVWGHPSAAEANAVLIYAWNEHDEGGWIAPTLAEGDARVRAIGKRLGGLCAAQ